MTENYMYMLDFDTYIKIVKLAQKHGKKAGDSMQEEMVEIMNKEKNIKYLGKTKLDKDMLAGELRDKGVRVLNLDEIKRRKENDKS